MATPHASSRSVGCLAVLSAGFAALGLLVLALRSLYVGMGQSYDSLLYARSLWGIAHDAWFNPAYGTHAFGIHLNLGLLPLAPFARVVPAAVVLAFAQAAAFGGTLALFVRAVGATKGVAWAGAAAALFLLSPLVVNPFVFDLRPGVVGVPLVFAGLLRLRRTGTVDAGVVAWLLAAAMVREEFALLGAAGLALAPLPRQGLRRRLLVAAGLCAYFAAYWFGIRPLLAGGERADDAAAALFAGDTAAWTYRLQLALALAATLGAWCWRGWRWAGAALPGVGLVLVLAKLPEHALSFHYAMFAAPGLLMAAVDGFDRPTRAPRAALAASLSIALAATLAFGAVPGGARFQADAFGFDAEASEWMGEVHATLDTIPRDAGVALPGPFAARFADRDAIYSMETLHAAIRRDGQAPADLDVAVLATHDWPTLGRWLVHHAAFQRVVVIADRFVVLQRGAPGSVNPMLGASAAASPPCATPEVAWLAVGLAGCRTSAGDAFVVVRIREADGPVPPLALERGAPPSDWAPLWLESGLVHPGQLPVGGWAIAPAAPPLSTGDALRLVDPSGREVPAADVRGASPMPAAPFRF